MQTCIKSITFSCRPSFLLKNQSILSQPKVLKEQWDSPVSVTSSRQSAEYRLCQVSIHCDASTPSACVSVYTSALLQSALMGIWLMISGPQTGLAEDARV